MGEVDRNLADSRVFSESHNLKQDNPNTLKKTMNDTPAAVNNILVEFLKTQIADQKSNYEGRIRDLSALYDNCKIQYQSEVDANRDLRVNLAVLVDKHTNEIEHEKRSAALSIKEGQKEGLSGLSKMMEGISAKDILGPTGLPGMLLAWKGINPNSSQATEPIDTGLEGMSDDLKGQIQNFAIRLNSGEIPDPDVVMDGAGQLAMLDSMDPQKLKETVALLHQQVVDLYKSKNTQSPIHA